MVISVQKSGMSDMADCILIPAILLHIIAVIWGSISYSVIFLPMGHWFSAPFEKVVNSKGIVSMCMLAFIVFGLFVGMIYAIIMLFTYGPILIGSVASILPCIQVV